MKALVSVDAATRFDLFENPLHILPVEVNRVDVEVVLIDELFGRKTGDVEAASGDYRQDQRSDETEATGSRHGVEPSPGAEAYVTRTFFFVNLTKCLAGLTFWSRSQKFLKADYSSAWPLARALPAPCRFARQGSSSPRAGNLNRKNTGRNAGNEKSSHDGHGGGGGRAGIRTAGLCHGCAGQGQVRRPVRADGDP